MGEIVSVSQAVKISEKLKNKRKTIVLVGGAFDILHLGHVKFLEKAKSQGDYLFILLESDKSVRKLKGKTRPFNKQKDRAEILAALNPVDFVVNLKNILKNNGYDKIVKQISPHILAITAKDPNMIHKERQAKLTGAKIKIVLKRLKNKSTTSILRNHE